MTHQLIHSKTQTTSEATLGDDLLRGADEVVSRKW